MNIFNARLLIISKFTKRLKAKKYYSPQRHNICLEFRCEMESLESNPPKVDGSRTLCQKHFHIGGINN